MDVFEAIAGFFGTVGGVFEPVGGDFGAELDVIAAMDLKGVDQVSSRLKIAFLLEGQLTALYNSPQPLALTVKD